MGKHRKIAEKALKRGWWQVIVPVITITAVVFLAAYSVSQYTSSQVRPVAASHPREGSYHPPPVKPALPSLSPVQTTVSYVVVSGDTLSSIASAHCGNPADYVPLAAANHLSPGSVLLVGTVLVIRC